MTSHRDHSATDVEFHAARAAAYDEEVASEYEIYDEAALLPFLDRFVGRGPGFTVLDVGCGTGAVTVQLVRCGFTVYAVDHSPEMIAVAKEKMQRENAAERVTFEICHAGELPFESGQFDVVTCQRVLHHIPDIQPVLAEVKRVLRPGGSFYLSDTVADSTPAARILRLLWKAVLRIAGEPQALHRPPEGHETHRRTDELTRLLDNAGFSYELRFFTHVGVQRYLSTKQRALLIRILSAPWKQKGDVLFAYANKPTEGRAVKG